jgi:hypothetical protein
MFDIFFNQELMNHSSVCRLRLASQNTPYPPGLNKTIEGGVKYEKEIFHTSPDKVNK